MSAAAARYEADTVYVTGELTFATVAALHRPPWPAGTTSLTVDLGGVTRADSAGLALLLEWARAARRQGREIRFRRTPAQLRSLAHVTGVDEILDLQ